MKSLKKVFTSFVSLTTILWSVGGTLMFPNVASAATLNPGDLIKASGPAVYYYGGDGKRYVFPNEKTYFSWYKDFSSVKTITDSELAAVTIGGNVTIRPGTKLVKITTDPKVYAVTGACATLHWIESETVAKALYTDTWAQHVVDVPDAFFVNYSVGTSIPTATHPDGSLISYVGDSNAYVVVGGNKRKVTDAGAAANRFDAANVIPTTIVYPSGADVTGYEAALGETACTSQTPVLGGSVSVALAADTPAGQNVPRNSNSNALVKVNVTAGSADASLNGLRFHRVGTGAAADFSNVYLYDQNLKRLTTGRTINTTTHVVEFNSLGLTIPAGTTISLYVYGDFAVAAGATGGQHAIEIQDAGSVIIGGSGTVSGSFPIRGNVFTVGVTAAARVDVTKGVQPSNPTIGTKDAEVSNFRITANTNDVEVRQITLYQAGSITNSDITNFKLWQGTTQVASAASVDSKNHLTLVFNPPYVITNGTTKTFKLTADVAGRAGRTFRTYVEYTTDVTAIDKVYNAGASICISATINTGGCTAANQGSFDGTTATVDYIEVTTQGGQLTVAFNGPPTANVAKGQLSVPLFKVTLSSPDNALEIRNLRFSLTSATGFVKGSAATEYFRNFKLVDLDTKQTVMGPIGMPTTVATPALTTGNMVFTDSWNLNAGQTRNLQIVADIANAEDAAGELFLNGNRAYALTMAAFGASDIRVVDTGEFLAVTKIVPNTAIIGNAQTVKSSNLTVALSTSPTGDTIVKKQQNIGAVGLSLTAGQQSDVTITSVKLTGSAQTAMASGYTHAKFGQLVTLLSLWDGAAQVGLAKAPDTVTGDAVITNLNISIPKGTSKALIVKATLASTVSSATGTDDFAVGVGTATDITAQDQDANTVTPTLDAAVIANSTNAGQTVIQKVRNSGIITYSQDSHPQTAILVAGGSAWKVMARVKATAQYEAATLDRIAIIHPNDGGMNSDFAAIAVAQNGDVTGRQDTFSAGTTGTRDIDLTNNKIVVPSGGSVSFEIWGKLATLSSTGTAATNPRSGDTPSLGIATSTVTGEWGASYLYQVNARMTGDASGERLYATTSNPGLVDNLMGKTMVLRKTVPTVTKLAVSSNTLSNGADTEIYKFQVTPDANGGAVAWKQIEFNITTSTNVSSLRNFKLFKGSTQLVAGTDVLIRTLRSGVDVTGNNTMDGSGVVIVRLVNEESVQGSGTVYTLRALPTFTGTGNTVNVQFARSTGGTVTGYIIDGDMGGSLAIDTSVGGGGGLLSASGTFVWSDNVEPLHSYASGTANGSRDWTNDVLLQDLTQSQVVSN